MIDRYPNKDSYGPSGVRCVFFVETGFHVSQSGLKLAMNLELLILLTGITDMCHQT